LEKLFLKPLNGVDMKINKIVTVLFGCSLSILLLGCGGFFPKTAEQLKAKSKSSASFTVKRDYVEVYRDISRIDASCFNFYKDAIYLGVSAIPVVQAEYRDSRSDLDREQKIGQIKSSRVGVAFASLVTVKEISANETEVEAWSFDVGYDVLVQSWAQGKWLCPTKK
jgi:hypothetical protein